jgi:membrane associated rhomboid family serine protease
MKQRPYATLGLILASLVVTATAAIFDGSIYGVESHATDWLSFSPAQPFRQFGLSWLLSAFLHLNINHLVTNLVILIPVALMIERKEKASHLVAISTLIHLMVLISLIIWQFFSTLQGKSFLGSSHLILGLYAYWSLYQRRWNLMILPTGVIIWELWQNQSSLIILAHILGISSGLILAKFRLQRSH